jgi:hypothetical protein
MKYKRKPKFYGVDYFKLNSILQNNGAYFLHQPRSVRGVLSSSVRGVLSRSGRGVLSRSTLY